MTVPRCAAAEVALYARARYAQFPTGAVCASFATLGNTASATVGPHKLGYLPHGADALIGRDRRALGMFAERADYVFRGSTPEDYLFRYRSLGQFVLEGSKAGTAAAAAYVTHRVLPLDHRHFGRLPRQTVLAAEASPVRAK